MTCRFPIPVRVLIHSSFVSTSDARSSFVSDCFGIAMPTPAICAPAGTNAAAIATVVVARLPPLVVVRDDDVLVLVLLESALPPRDATRITADVGADATAARIATDDDARYRSIGRGSDRCG
jgi:hypothetical protein